MFFLKQCFRKFLKTSISQGSVATCFKCGGIFKGHFIANLLLILAVKKFFKNLYVISGDSVSVFFSGTQCLSSATVVLAAVVGHCIYGTCADVHTARFAQVLHKSCRNLLLQLYCIHLCGPL